MAIKDSLVSEILKREGNTKNSNSIYKRLKILDNAGNQNFNDVPKETEHKLNTNHTQTEHKPYTISDTNRTQTEHRFDPIQKTEHKPNTKLNTISNTNWTQTEHKLNTNYVFSSLIGLQRNILFFLFQHCKKTRNRVTQELSLIHVAQNLKMPIGSVKTTFARLGKKGFIKRKEFKNGRGGWSRYELPDNIYTELLHLETEHKLNTKWTQTEHKVDTKLNTQPNTTFSSSSDLYIKTTTTSESETKQNLSNFEEWKKLDFEPLVEIGFSQTHLLQIAKQNLLEPIAVQESIYAFAFDLEKNSKEKSLKKNPIDYFMGILRNGSVYAPPANYKSPKQIAFETFVEQQKRIQELEEKAVNLGFENWVSKITSEEKNAIIPEETKKMGVSGLMNHALRTHFKENIWPNVREEIMKPLSITEHS